MKTVGLCRDRPLQTRQFNEDAHQVSGRDTAEHARLASREKTVTTKTGTDRETDKRIDNTIMGRQSNPFKVVEAGIGIEPIFTDLQSAA